MRSKTAKTYRILTYAFILTGMITALALSLLAIVSMIMGLSL